MKLGENRNFYRNRHSAPVRDRRCPMVYAFPRTYGVTIIVAVAVLLRWSNDANCVASKVTWCVPGARDAQ